MTCNGVCENYKATKPAYGGRYEDGQKRCQTCQIFVYYNGLFCPCCNMRLRTNSRYTKLKERVIPLIRF